MFRNYIKIAYRNLLKNKVFSFLNISGLALGFTACFLIALFIWDEYRYDDFIPEGDRVYRIYNQHSDNQGTEEVAVTSPAIATTLKDNFPEVEQTTRIFMNDTGKKFFEVGEKKLYQEGAMYVDSTFLQVFPLELKYGSLTGALDNPASIVISEDMADRFFGNENPVGKEILMDKTFLTVKGVFQKNPKFHLQFESLLPLSLEEISPERMQNWDWEQFYNYVKMKEGADLEALKAKFLPMAEKKLKEYSDNESSISKLQFQPLKEIHLHSSSFVYDNAKRGNITYVRALSFIAVFILLIACFNFINLATAKSLQRAKEVGVRKTIGADRKQLIFQFLAETVFLTVISILLSLVITFLLLPWLNEFTGKEIEYAILFDPPVLLTFFGLTISVGILAGFYPALVLSSFKPVKVLKGSAAGEQQPGKIPLLRHGLVVLQFSMSVLLIICAIVVFNQVNYLHNKDLGFSKDQIMFFPMRGSKMYNNTEAFKNQLEQIQGVSSVSIGYGFPGDAVAGHGVAVQKDGQLVDHSANQFMIDYDYIETLGLKIVAGRPFSEDMGTDQEKAYIINETAVKNFGFGTPENAIGKELRWNVWNDTNPDSVKIGPVVGVVKDFNYKSLYEEVGSAVLQIFPDVAWKVAVKMETAQVQSSLVQVENVWNAFSPDFPLEYKFLDENFEQMYSTEDKLKTLLGVFTALAILIGCLGLFGLVAFSAERRTKEIGIRKVLGASVQNIVVLLSKDFLKLVVVAILIASPVAWYFMQGWLEDFAYRIDMSWWIFLLAGLSAVLIAVLTVSFHAIKAAFRNPVKNLRIE